MADTLTIEPYLRHWVEERVPGLAGKVRPAAAEQHDRPPYATYTRVGGYRTRHLEGPSGTSVVVVQLDVWADSPDEAQALADRVAGTRADPGLDGFTGLMGDPAAPRAFVQDAAADDPRWLYAEPESGQGGGRVACSRDYRIWFEETLVED